MRKNLFVSCVAAVLTLGAGLSCDDPAAPDEVDLVQIVGADRSVGVNQTIQFDGRAQTTQGVRVDELITWSVSTTGIITVTAQLVTVGTITANRATVTGVAPGGVDLIATAGGRTSSVRITVTGSAPGA